MTYDIEEIKKHLYKKLKYKRYNHSLGVMYTAQALAMRYNFPIYSAGVAGILHVLQKHSLDFMELHHLWFERTE